MKKLGSLLIMVTIILFSTSDVFASNLIEPYGLKPPGESYTPGEWFLGETPSNVDPNKPPVVFVQGKNGNATSWYSQTEYHGLNDMYTKAYEAGYQTVFLQLYDAAGEGSYSQYDNGKLLASMLKEISQHFNGKKLNIIAHSKGGPDTQAALVLNDAHSYVGRVFTLGSPHYGSELADLAYSWWAGWLATLLGEKDDGTYSLQVGEMEHFRSLIDNHPNVSKNRYYTIAGTNTGPFLSALWMGGLYLSDPNDGLVKETSTKLSYGTHLFTDTSLDHDRIRMGSAVFSRLEQYLQSASTAHIVENNEYFSQSDTFQELDASHYFYGGKLQSSNDVTHSFYVDTALDNVKLWTRLTSDKIELVSPSGKKYTNQTIKSFEEASFFNGGVPHTFTDVISEKGEWKLNISTQAGDNAYLLAVQHGGPSLIKVSIPTVASETNNIITMQANHQLQKLTFDLRVLDPTGKDIASSLQIQKVNQQNFMVNFPANKKSGVYNITLNIAGETIQGEPYKRTIVRSKYIK
ncbi:pimeloyl-ACP methyl ester carboxylesterase [Lysinibacillus parviboronicapiens]|uniref:Pimeloyl-ACP methyl ester carboxylesterase n=1 Tax=Lysinibacillus parviboronicapiens TaxID=436516 RepID=A0ABV2PH23_9BACI